MYEIFDWSFIILCFLVNDTTNSWYRFATFAYIVVVNIFLSFLHMCMCSCVLVRCGYVVMCTKVRGQHSMAILNICLVISDKVLNFTSLLLLLLVVVMVDV